MSAGVIFPSSSSKDLLNKNPQISNIIVPSINTEQSIVIPTDVRKFSIKCRGTAKLKISFTTAESSTNYLTVPVGCMLSEENIDQGCTIYFQLDRADTVELLTWQKL